LLENHLVLRAPQKSERETTDDQWHRNEKN